MKLQRFCGRKCGFLKISINAVWILFTVSQNESLKFPSRNPYRKILFKKALVENWLIFQEAFSEVLLERVNFIIVVTFLVPIDASLEDQNADNSCNVSHHVIN
jgi:hypothetical protein